ncbi:NADP-dependent phosphogluconate dehydrogenase [Sphingobacterium tabacisoli]|uniref:6-phosphogluconate dehydrogenase, decarboxylating n=1 Tax=Sphingobacterium tabacisoli TaxID=2044855 RepID=A0ABW5L307_9SPHI|nr:NADP-dependent phosphogluconate dehydrogenase [Sphingobacterium tabacisoli]
MELYDFGIVGLGVMGRNLLLNMADNKFAVAGLDLDLAKVQSLENEINDTHQVKATTSVADFTQAIRKPRAIMLLVPAGNPVDSAINSLLPHLEEGDIIIDGGNSYFPDTDRRFIELSKKNIHFFGMGISGGEKGARFGPSLMPGGDKGAYERLRPIFEAVAAKVNGEPCVTYLGNGSAGNYVKMVHNGIEYGVMQLIAETYDLMKRGFGIDDDKIQQTFADWNKGELQSFLVEITSEILNKFDEDGQRLVHVISDWAKSKGTGKWTSQNAMDLQAPIPVIDAAVTMRDMSKLKPERIQASEKLTWSPTVDAIDKDKVIEQIKDAFYFAMLNTYAQGLSQLTIASEAYNYGLDLEQVAKIWRGGCIIRAAALEDFRQAYSRNPALRNILLDDTVAQNVSARQEGARATIKYAVDNGIPFGAYMNALAYFDSYRSERMPTNIIQAQRDYFGAHTYERIDREGSFHTQWD